MKGSKVVKFPIILLVLIFAFGLLMVKVNKPFWGHHDWISVEYSNVARNYIRYGYLQTKFGQVANEDYQKKENFSYITHYPPLLPILISISFQILGELEISARLMIIAFSLVLILFIYKVGEELQSKFLGVYASLLLITTPIYLYFGKLPVHDTIVPAVSMAGFWAYLRYTKTNNIKYYIFLAITLIFGGFINWSALYLVVALLYLQITTKTTKLIRRNILILIPLSVLIFLGQAIHIHFLKTDLTGSIFSNVLTRINPYLTSDLYGFSFIKYLRQEILLMKVYYTLPIFLGSVAFTLYFIYKLILKRQKLAFTEIFLSSLLIYGLIQLVIFSQLSFIHDFMIYYLAPFMSLSSGRIIIMIARKFKRSIIYPVVLISIVYFAFLGQLKFTNALIATDTNKRGYLIGQLINKESPSGTVSYITSDSYKDFQEVFIGYYSDRNIAYGEDLPKNFDKLYTLVIRPKDHDPLSKEEKELLDAKYLRYEDQNFIWYKLLYKKS